MSLNIEESIYGYSKHNMENDDYSDDEWFEDEGYGVDEEDDPYTNPNEDVEDVISSKKSPVRFPPTQYILEPIVVAPTINWATFKPEQESNMVVLGKIPMGRNVVKTPITNLNMGLAKAKAHFKLSKPKKSSHNKPIGPIHHFCISITKGIQCPNHMCRYAHHFNQIEQCVGQCKGNVKAIHDDFYVVDKNVDQLSTYKCLKRHHNECIESYILRLGLIIYNITNVVVTLPKNVIDEHITTLLVGKNECMLERLVVKVKVDKKIEIVVDDMDEDDDPEWYSYKSKPRRPFQWFN